MNTRFRADSIKTGSKSTKMWDQDTQQGAIVPIATATVVNTTDTSIGFANIPQIYQDLMLVVSSRRTDAVTEGTQFLYSYAGAIGSVTKLTGDGASITSSRNTGQNALFIGPYPGASAATGVFATQIVHILNYTNTSNFKSFLTRSACDRNGGGQTELSVGLMRDTGALTSCGVSTYNAAVYYVPGSTATLYGIKAGA
jgi:hypothetical protein